MNLQPLPPAVTSLARHYAGGQQRPVAYIVSSWRGVLAAWPGVAVVLEDDRWTRPATLPGRRLVDRADLADLTASVDLTDPLAVRRAFLLVMAWGSGTSNTRSYRYVKMALTSPACDRQLLDAALTCRQGDLQTAYDRFKLPGVGRSFFTKWFAFAGRTPDRAWQPLILDDRVFRTLNKTLGVYTNEIAGSSGRGLRYRAYVEQLHAWAGALREDGVDCDAERLEWIFFEHNGRQLPG